MNLSNMFWLFVSGILVGVRMSMEAPHYGPLDDLPWFMLMPDYVYEVIPIGVLLWIAGKTAFFHLRQKLRTKNAVRTQR